MNAQLKLLAYELHAAGNKLRSEMVVANAGKKSGNAQIAKIDSWLMQTIRPLNDMARKAAVEIKYIASAKTEPRLAEGGQALLAAMSEFQPVMAEVDAWLTAHNQEPPSWTVVGRSNGILKQIFSDLYPPAKPLTCIEKAPGFMIDTSINAHLDAGIAAAESVRSGNRHHAARVIMHAKELAELVKNSHLESGTEARITKLIYLVDQILTS